MSRSIRMITKTYHRLPYEWLIRNWNNPAFWSYETDNLKEFESTLATTKCSKYWNWKNHLANFCNSYMVEKGIVDLYKDILEFNNPDMHAHLYRGKGKYGCDCRTKVDHDQIEIKMFNEYTKFDKWRKHSLTTFDANYDAVLIIVYVVDTNTLYAIDGPICRPCKRQFDKPFNFLPIE